MKKPITVRLSKELHEKLRQEAFKLRISLNKLIVMRISGTDKCITCSMEPPANCLKCTVAAYKLGEEKGYSDAYNELK